MTHEHPDDFDSPWKEALEQALPDFLALFFPDAHAGIDWSRGYRFRDKELQQVVRDAEFGRRYADKLAEVYTLDGAETWVLAQLQALTHRSGSARKFAKLRLIRFLYQRDYTREQILAWFRVLDWMLRLPEDLEKEFMIGRAHV